jgi:signal transduction histidine kinase
MGLINKINLRFLALLLIVFTLAGVGLYFVLGYVVTDNIDEILENRAEKVKHSIKMNPNQELSVLSPDQSIKIDLVSPCKRYKEYSDTSIYDAHEKENVECRKLTFVTIIRGQYYKFQITLSRFEMEDMVHVIFYFMIILFACIVIVLFFINKRLSSSLWSPFFKTLGKLKGFKAGQKEKLLFDITNIKEFNQLNVVLTEMIQKIQADFSNLKEFTENASHEIQTPIAIIKSKLESVLQDKLLPEEHQNQVKVAYKTISRLSKLNEGLLLLSKIENRQFADEIEINLCSLINERAVFVEDLLSLKNISISLNLQTQFSVSINSYLADILVNNLLNNAIKHNVENGQIIISSFKDQIVFSNTGKPLTVDPDKIFRRFVKNTETTESTGLGLSIASEICLNYNLYLDYSYQNGFHLFTLSKKK